MTAVDDYLNAVRGSMLGMDARVRDDILRELQSHLTEAIAANGGDANRAMASLGSPVEVGREYRRVYGYGVTFRLAFVAAAALLALLSSPFLSVSPDGAVPNLLSLPLLLVLVAWLLWVSAAAGSRVGLYAGIAALVIRFLIAAALALAYPGASVEVLGGLTFAVSNVLLVFLGWLPGTAKKAWSRPSGEL